MARSSHSSLSEPAGPAPPDPNPALALLLRRQRYRWAWAASAAFTGTYALSLMRFGHLYPGLLQPISAIALGAGGLGVLLTAMRPPASRSQRRPWSWVAWALLSAVPLVPIFTGQSWLQSAWILVGIQLAMTPVLVWETHALRRLLPLRTEEAEALEEVF